MVVVLIDLGFWKVYDISGNASMTLVRDQIVTR